MFSLYWKSLSSILYEESLDQVTTSPLGSNTSAGNEFPMRITCVRVLSSPYYIKLLLLCQSCQGIHSTYSVLTLSCLLTNLYFTYSGSGLELYYGYYGYSDGYNITSDLTTIIC